MLVKFMARGKGGGSGPVDYLLGKDRQREGATVLRGDPEQVRELINSAGFSRNYTSAVLSFEESSISPELRQQCMDEFERVLLPGLDADQYSALWVEHTDKGRVELNVVIPNVELQSGKRLQPYYDPADRPRVDAWKTAINAEHGLADPDDPTRQRALSTSPDLPRERKTLSEALTRGLMAQVGEGLIRTRKDVLEAIQSVGLEISRVTRNSISVKAPDGGKNIRLKGTIYERDFEFSQELRGKIEA
ncbi:relaxase/mobilization nuclease domain-containing protein, partial [Shigella sonnei]|nr:relaxase/mobilization nuclease domain-containing protein [Shigella sonnei]